MDKFIADINTVLELINDNKDSKSIINTSILSKQYLAYYLYRIFIKYITILKLRLHQKILIIY